MRIECRENQAAIWVIESPRVRRKIIGELLEQFHGKAGQFVLSDQEKELDIGKSAEIIVDLQIAAYYGRFGGTKRPQCGAELPGFLLI